ncbi:hypothetical protein ACERNI_17030 [Camelimonas sp. ID_303_24]
MSATSALSRPTPPGAASSGLTSSGLTPTGRLIAAVILVLGGLGAPAQAAENAAPAPAPRANMVWGANGHPLVSYPGVSMEQQATLLSEMNARSYRVDVTSLNQMETLARLHETLAARGIETLPVLNPPVNLKEQDQATLKARSRAFAEAFVRRLPNIQVWELGNELENYAIIQPCEMRDDGTKYPCEWGPAGGVGELDYVGARYKKVAAVLSGLAEGVAAANPKARRALGSAGWGHTGIFGRLAKDGVPWEISVWHWYANDPEWAFKILAGYGKPIWITEFNHEYGSQRDGKEGQAKGLASMMETLKRLAGPYRIEAAHVYELLDETYWAPHYEAYMGLVELERGGEHGWRIGARKPAFDAFRKAATP